MAAALPLRPPRLTARCGLAVGPPEYPPRSPIAPEAMGPYRFDMVLTTPADLADALGVPLDLFLEYLRGDLYEENKTLDAEMDSAVLDYFFQHRVAYPKEPEYEADLKILVVTPTGVPKLSYEFADPDEPDSGLIKLSDLKADTQVCICDLPNFE